MTNIRYVKSIPESKLKVGANVPARFTTASILNVLLSTVRCIIKRVDGNTYKHVFTFTILIRQGFAITLVGKVYKSM